MGPVKVLVVDDDRRILNLINLILKHHGFEAITTTSGAEAITLAKEKKPDIVLLDMLMPEMSGQEVLKSLRSFSHIPVMVYSANLRLIMESGATGFDDYILKPFSPDVLISKIEAVLNGHKTE